MKKQILFSVCFLSISIARAQNVQTGFHLSLNLNNISGDGMQNAMQAGYSAGAYSQIKLNGRFSLQPEVLYSQKNIRASANFKSVYPEKVSSNFRSDILLDYITMPVLVNYKLNDSWSVNLGPQYSYLVSNDEKLLKENQQAFKKQDISLIAGVEWQIAALKLYGRYNYGVANSNNISSLHKWYSRGVELGAGWRLFKH